MAGAAYMKGTLRPGSQRGIFASLRGSIASAPTWAGFVKTMPGSAIAMFLACAATAGMAASAWPPVMDSHRVDTYRHGARKEWGYTPKAASSVFYVIRPEQEQKHAPLYVVLHSAGHSAWDAVQVSLGRPAPWVGSGNDHAVYRTPPCFYGLYLSDDKAKTWWGRGSNWTWSQKDMEKYTAEDSPVEKRMLDTIAWVIEKYSIDPDRVYLAGCSMGGSGALGLGMCHGDVFAAVQAWVPAGAAHVARRMFFGKDVPAGVSIPDPPVVVSVSAQNDKWSKGQELLIEGAAARKYALVMGWAPFGHRGDTKLYARECGPVMAFPWREMRRNEAYPVFTGATSNQAPPWPDSKSGDPKGQINAFFRWKNVEDTPAAFSMDIWLDPPGAGKERAFSESVADVTFRRLQQFKVPHGSPCRWELAHDGAPVASGEIKADAAGLLTIPKMRIFPVITRVLLKAVPEKEKP